MTRVLALDGGGVRGIMSATILAAFEERSGKPTHELFDLIAGTSTGGILALGLTSPDPNSSEPRYRSARDLVDLYLKHAQEIFPSAGPVWKHGVDIAVARATLGLSSIGKKVATKRGWRGSPEARQRERIRSAVFSPWRGNTRYSTEGIGNVLENYFGERKMSDLATPVLITAFDLRTAEPEIFRREPEHRLKDFYVHEVAQATSAAPTFLPPVQLTTDHGAEWQLADGGLCANNPAVLALTDALASKPDEPVTLVSIGTGTARRPTKSRDDLTTVNLLSFGMDLLEMFFEGSSQLQDKMMESFERAGYVRDYLRLQYSFVNDLPALNDSSPECLSKLRAWANDTVEEKSREIDHFLELLTTKKDSP